jgi:hypothetical protein
MGGVVVWSLSFMLIVFSSPMPSDVDAVDVVMGCGLVLGGLQMLFVGFRSGQSMARKFWLIFLLFVLIVFPLVVGLYNDNVLKDMVRDVLPVMFLTAIPALLVFAGDGLPQRYVRRAIITALLFVGVVSSVQFTVGVVNEYGSVTGLVKGMRQGLLQLSDPVRQSSDDISKFVEAGEAANVVRTHPLSKVFLKAYDPAVMFAAIFLFGLGLRKITSGTNLVRLYAAFSMALGIFCAYTLVSLGLRAHALLMVFSWIIILFNYASRLTNVKTLTVAVVICAAVVGFYFQDALYLMMVKQASVGTNGKVAEFNAVIGIVLADVNTLMFGEGWGAKFYNPILMYETRFTHSLLSFLLLKTGVIGLFVLAGLFSLLFKRIVIKRLWDSPDGWLLVMAVVPPIVIGIATQPVYKMLSYGLVVALLVLVLRENSGSSGFSSRDNLAFSNVEGGG